MTFECPLKFLSNADPLFSQKWPESNQKLNSASDSTNNNINMLWIMGLGNEQEAASPVMSRELGSIVAKMLPSQCVLLNAL